MGYQEKFQLLKNWCVEILDVVKKDLKNEHLKIDRMFCRKYFFGKSLSQIDAQQMAPAYEKEIFEGNVGLGEFIASRWLIKNSEIYNFFEIALKKINPDFDELDELNDDVARSLLDRSLQEFGPSKVYIFSVFNSVVFPKELYDELKELAEKETCAIREEEKQIDEAKTVQAMTNRHTREMKAMIDRYEKKLLGLQKKYLKDVETLKKQIANLTRKHARESSGK